MKPKAMRHSRGVWCVLMSAILALGGMGTALAFTASDRTNCWNAWNNNFYVTLTGPNRAYYRNQQGSNNSSSFWQSAEEIEIAEDANDTNRVVLLCTGFTQNFGTDWSGNTYNDDLEWASIAFVRAYQMTGNASYLTYSENGLNLAYSRGWDTAGGGGIWQNTADASGPGKLSCANGPATIGAYLIYQSTGNTNYLNMAQTINTWQKANNYNPTTGEVYESNTSTNTCYSYDSGTFAAACWYLGDTNTPIQCGDWVKSNWGIPMQHFGTGADAGGFNGICMRWLGKVGYDPGFLRAVVDNAWALTNSAGLVSDGWYGGPTSDTNLLYAWDCGSIVAAMFCVTPTQPGLVSGQVYQLEPQNAPGLRLDVRNGGTNDGTQVQIYTTNNTTSQKWMLTAIDATNNIYSLQPQNALNECLGIQGGGSASGTPVQIFTASNTLSQNWKFIVIDPTNGIYSLQPQNATGMRLDVYNGNTAPSTPVQIYTSNGTPAQQWKLYPFPAPTSPTFQGFVPSGGSIDVPVNTSISVQVVVGNLPITNLLLNVDGNTVTPSTSTNSGIITVNYQPSPALSAGSLHTAQIIVNDSSGSAFTNTWSFTTGFTSVQTTNAYDVAANSAYTGEGPPDGLSSGGQNGGFGFGAWRFTVQNTGGAFIQTNGPSGDSFDLWNTSASSSTVAIRPFSSPLVPGQSFSVQLRLNSLDNSGTTNALILQDASGHTLFSYWHYGYEANANNGEYSDATTNDGTAVNFQYAYTQFQSFTFTLNSPTNYTFTDNSTSASFTGRISNSQIAQVAFFRGNSSAGTTSGGNDFQFDVLEILSASPPTFDVTPAPGALSVPVTNSIVLQVTASSVGLNTSVASMTVDGSPVTPTIGGSSSLMTVSYAPNPALSAGSMHTAQVVVQDDNDVSYTNTWSFTTGFSSLPAVLPGPFTVSNSVDLTIFTAAGDPWLGTNYLSTSSQILYARFSMEFDTTNNTGSIYTWGGMDFFQGSNEKLLFGKNGGSASWSTAIGGANGPALNPVVAVVPNNWHTIVARINYQNGSPANETVWLDPDFTQTEANQPHVPITLSDDNTFDNIRLRCGFNDASATFSNIVMAATTAQAGFQPASPPHITGIGLTGTTLSISATNGTAGGSWTLLQSTNLALPLSQWQTNCAGIFDGNGNLSTNIANTATNDQQFYILKVQ